MAEPVRVDRIKRMIVESLNLPNVRPDDFADDDSLFGGGLGIDSVDVLELVLAVETEFGIQIEDDEVGKEAFASARALTDFVNSRLAAAS